MLAQAMGKLSDLPLVPVPGAPSDEDVQSEAQVAVANGGEGVKLPSQQAAQEASKGSKGGSSDVGISAPTAPTAQATIAELI